MDMITKLIEGIIILILAIYLLINGLFPNLSTVNTTNMAYGGTDYSFIVGILVLVLIFGLTLGLYKHFYGGKK